MFCNQLLPIRRSNKWFSFAHGLSDLRWDSKICQFDVSVFREEDIGSFDVSMDFAFGVEITEAFESLPTHVRDLGLHQRTGHVIDILFERRLICIMQYGEFLAKVDSRGGNNNFENQLDRLQHTQIIRKFKRWNFNRADTWILRSRCVLMAEKNSCVVGPNIWSKKLRRVSS